MINIKEVFKKVIIWILTLESKIILKRFNPKIIAITGSVGKTTTKDVAYTALKKSVYVRKNEKSFNSEIGVPLTVLALPNGWSNPRIWLVNVLQGAWKCVTTRKYPEYLIIETGVDRPGDISEITSWLKPNVSVITTLPQIPVHVEFFKSKESVWEEKRKLVSALSNDGCAILNMDDSEVMKTSVPEGVKVFTYGHNDNSDVRFSNYSINYEEGKPVGISATITTKRGDEASVEIDGVIGVHHLYPVVSSIAIGLSLDIDFNTMIESIESHKPTPGRMRILDGYDDNILIDDSYNSSPQALRKAVEQTGEIECGGNRIAILGEMLELGKESAGAHKEIGEILHSNNFNQLITIGVRSTHIASGSIDGGMSLDNIKSFSSTDDEELYKYLKDLVDKNDIILIKGSQGSRMEKVTKYLLDDPKLAKDLLVRQDSVWLKK